MGARLLTSRDRRARRQVLHPGGRRGLQALGQSCVEPRRARRLRGRRDRKVLLAPLPADLEQLAAHPLIAEKLMPVLGVVRSPSVEHGIAACSSSPSTAGLGHTSAVYATDEDVIDRFAPQIRTGRILVNAPTAVGALGGVYNAMTRPSRWGAARGAGRTPPRTSTTAICSTSRRCPGARRRRSGSACPRTPTSTSARSRACARSAPAGDLVTDGPTEARGVADDIRATSVHVARCTCSRRSSPSRPRSRSAPGSRSSKRFDADSIIAVGGGSVMDAAKAMRLFAREPAADDRGSSRCPSWTPRKRIAAFPQKAAQGQA